MKVVCSCFCWSARKGNAPPLSMPRACRERLQAGEQTVQEYDIKVEIPAGAKGAPFAELLPSQCNPLHVAVLFNHHQHILMRNGHVSGSLSGASRHGSLLLRLSMAPQTCLLRLHKHIPRGCLGYFCHLPWSIPKGTPWSINGIPFSPIFTKECLACIITRILVHSHTNNAFCTLASTSGEHSCCWCDCARSLQKINKKRSAEVDELRAQLAGVQSRLGSAEADRREKLAAAEAQVAELEERNR